MSSEHQECKTCGTKNQIGAPVCYHCRRPLEGEIVRGDKPARTSTVKKKTAKKKKRGR